MTISDSCRWAAALLVVLTVFSAAHAAAPGDAQKLAACLKTSDAGAKQAVACVDFLDCRAQGPCLRREADAWRKRVDELVRRIETSDPSTAEPLKTAQLKWQQSLSSLCPLFDNRDPGVGLSGDFCRAREIAMRALDLEQLDYALGEH